jgi:hypothetical protein
MLEQPLRNLILQQSDALYRYGRLAREIGDPVADVALGLILTDTERHRALLRRIDGGALDDVESPSKTGGVDAPRVICELADLARGASTRGQVLRDVACAARGRDCAQIAMLLDAMATDCDKHARLLGALARALTQRAALTRPRPAATEPSPSLPRSPVSQDGSYQHSMR